MLHTKPRFSRWRLRFSLSTLLLAVLFVGCALTLRARWEPWYILKTLEGLPIDASPDKRHVLFTNCQGGDFEEFLIYDTNGFREVARLKCPRAAAAFSLNNSVTILECDGLYEWNPFTGAKTLRWHYPRACDSVLGCISPFSRAALFDEYFWSTRGSNCCLMDLKSRDIRVCKNNSAVRGGSFSSDGSYCAFGTGHWDIEVWDVQNGVNRKIIVPGGPVAEDRDDNTAISAQVNASTFAHGDKRLVVGHNDGWLRVWDLGSFQEINARKLGDRIFQVGYSQSNNRMFALTRDDTGNDGDSIEIMDGDSLAHIASLRLKDTLAVCQPFLSLDESTVLMGCADTETRVWQRRRPECWWGIAWMPEFWIMVLIAFRALYRHAKRYKPKQDSP